MHRLDDVMLPSKMLRSLVQITGNVRTDNVRKSSGNCIMELDGQGARSHRIYYRAQLQSPVTHMYSTQRARAARGLYLHPPACGSRIALA